MKMKIEEFVLIEKKVAKKSFENKRDLAEDLSVKYATEFGKISKEMDLPNAKDFAVYMGIKALEYKMHIIEMHDTKMKSTDDTKYGKVMAEILELQREGY